MRALSVDWSDCVYGPYDAADTCEFGGATFVGVCGDLVFEGGEPE